MLWFGVLSLSCLLSYEFWTVRDLDVIKSCKLHKIKKYNIGLIWNVFIKNNTGIQPKGNFKCRKEKLKHLQWKEQCSKNVTNPKY